MTRIAQLTRCSALAVAVLLDGCATETTPLRINVAGMTINSFPVEMVLDTGASSTMLYGSTASRIGLKFAAPQQYIVAGNFQILTGMSDPAEVSAGGQPFTVRLPVYTPSGQTPLEDGVIGWPEIRDNVLLFDSARRSVRRVERAPDTPGWIKLNVRRHDTLLLETPLAEGKTGVILVDTGAPQGVQLTAAQWKAFKAAHPNEPSTATSHFAWSSGSFAAEVTQVREITLGPLTLADVPVENMPASEDAWLQKSAPDDEVIGIIGLRALARMDLVLDGKNDVAYIRTGVKHPAALRSWTVAENVHLNYDSLLLWSAIDRCSSGDLSGAVSDCSRAVQLNPKDADAYATRGMIRQIRGEFPGAVADYEKVIELSPEYAVTAQLHRQTLLGRVGRPAEDFSTTVAGWPAGWTKTLGLFIADRLSEEALLAAAQSPNQQCEAFYYVGLKRLSKGDVTGARDYFQKSIATGVTEYTEYQFATAELARLPAATR